MELEFKNRIFGILQSHSALLAARHVCAGSHPASHGTESGKFLADHRVTAFFEQDQYLRHLNALLLCSAAGLSSGCLPCPVFLMNH